MLAVAVEADGMILRPTKGAEMNGKRTYEKPELQRLGLLRDLTKHNFSNFNGFNGPS
jgi:hypothetical protein